MFTRGTVVDGRKERYEVERPLGEGGFAKTYVARRQSDGREVVLKVLRLDQAGSWKVVELFEREAKALRRIRHPHVPEYLDDVTREEGNEPIAFVLVQEYVPGPTLREMMTRGTGLDDRAMRAWLVTILEVCDYLHGLSPPIIHRDIHPGNVVLRESDGEAILIDFGIVQVAARSASTVSSTAAGTFGYAPLEQFVGRATPASDLYSLAVTYLAVASGLSPDRMPFAGNRIQVSEILRNTRCDPRLVLLLDEMTEPDAARRPQSAAEVLERLRGIGSVRQPRTLAAAPPSRPDSEVVAGRVAAVERRWREAAARVERVEKPWPLGTYPEPEDVDGFVVTPDGRQAWVLLGRGNCALLDTDSFHLNKVLEAPEYGIGKNVTLCADGSGVLAAEHSGATLFVAAADGRVDQVQLAVPSDTSFWMQDHHLAVGVSGDRRQAAFALTFGEGQGGYLVDLSDGRVIQRFKLPPGGSSFGYEALLFAADRRSLALVARLDKAHVLDAQGGWTDLDARGLAFSEDRAVLAVADGDGRSVRVGAVDGLAPLSWRDEAIVVWQGEDRPRSLRLSPDGARLALGLDGERVLALDVASGRVLLEAEQPHRPGRRLERVETLGFSADGERLFVHGRCARHPEDMAPGDCVAVYDVSGDRPLGTLVREGDEGVRLMGVTCDGFFGSPTGKGKGQPGSLRRPDAVAAALRGDVAIERLPEGERDGALDLSDRVRFWAHLVGEGRITGSKALRELVDASQGITHLLPVAVARAMEMDDDAPRLGEAGGRGASTLPTKRLLDALHVLANRTAGEQEALFEEMLAGALGEERIRAEDEVRDRARERRKASWARHRRWVLVAAALAAATLFALTKFVWLK